MKIIVGISGASGIEYGIHFLKTLKKMRIKTFLIMSEWAKRIAEEETSYKYMDIKKIATKYFENNEMDAPIASSSFLVDGMVVIPCSIKTMSEIANAHCGTLMSKAADNMLKMRKPLVVCPRDTPLSVPALENLYKISLAGGIVMPLCPGFYHMPTNLQDLFDFITGKILDTLNIKNSKYKRWK
jgi:4-hydroxy-3-polyprenylbenzoate decarboxylase